MAFINQISYHDTLISCYYNNVIVTKKPSYNILDGMWLY